MLPSLRDMLILSKRTALVASSGFRQTTGWAPESLIARSGDRGVAYDGIDVVILGQGPVEHDARTER